MTAVSSVRSHRRLEFHALTVASVERLTDDSVAVTFDVPDDLAGDVPVRGRPASDGALG